MVVVLIIGVLVSVAIPVFIGARANAERKTCFANEREIEGVIIVWQVDAQNNSLAQLAGVVNASNPLVAASPERSSRRYCAMQTRCGHAYASRGRVSDSREDSCSTGCSKTFASRVT